MATSKVTRLSTLAQRAQELATIKNNPFGAMTPEEATVLLHGLETQNIEDLLAVKEAYPDVWEQHKKQVKGRWVFEREVYMQLKEFATGKPAVNANEL